MDNSTFTFSRTQNPNSTLNFIVIGLKNRLDTELCEALEQLGRNVIYSDRVYEDCWRENDVRKIDLDPKTVYVLSEFNGPNYDLLKDEKCHILGPPAVKFYAKNPHLEPYLSRPNYCTILRSKAFCFTGYRVKVEMERLAKLIHLMGGRIRENLHPSVTHLIAKYPGGDKYERMERFGLGITCITGQWIDKAWEFRDRDLEGENINIDKELAPYRLIVNNYVSYHGFKDEALKEFQKLCHENNTRIVAYTHPQCTHLVIKDRELARRDGLSEKDIRNWGVRMVTEEWLRANITPNKSLP